MIQKYISDLAAKMGIELTKIDLVDGKSVGCLDVYLVKISAHSHETAVLVYKADLDSLALGIISSRLETRVRTALSRLQGEPEPRP